MPPVKWWGNCSRFVAKEKYAWGSKRHGKCMSENDPISDYSRALLAHSWGTPCTPQPWKRMSVTYTAYPRSAWNKDQEAVPKDDMFLKVDSHARYCCWLCYQ